jgi:hypothetical protein
LDHSGEASGSILLDEVYPSDLIEFDQTFQPASGANAVELSVLSKADGEVRLLGKCDL